MFILKAIKTLVFGAGVKETVFERWLQPLCWSEKEPTALLQNAGGPCAVLAPLQVSRIYVQDDKFNSLWLSESFYQDHSILRYSGYSDLRTGFCQPTLYMK